MTDRRTHGMNRPPTQVLHGGGFVLHYNPDTAPGWPAIKLVRRARVVSTAGIVRSRVQLVTYEVYTDGEIRRVGRDGEAKIVLDGHAEWRWARDVLAALRSRGALPPDFVRWKIAPGTRRAEYTGARLATPK
jgi:hypothetical protein